MNAPSKLGADSNFTIAENLCRVISNDAVNAEYRLIVVDAPAIALTSEAGQFFHLACPAYGEDHPFLRRPMSVYDIDRKGRRIAFLYKVQGAGTRGLARLAAGEYLDALGPLGRGFSVPITTRHALLLGRGVGLATLAPLAVYAAERGASVTAVLSARSPEFLMSQTMLQAHGARVLTVTDEDDTSDVASVESLLRELHAEKPFDYMATCGSNRLFVLLKRLAADWDAPGEVALEQHMGCGLGMCFACVRTFVTRNGQQDYRRVCWDGPVFDIAEAVSW